MIDIVIATRNQAKARELGALLRVPGVRWRSLDEFPGAPEVHEDGRTFLANATKKARAAARHTGRLALADDSGLEVDALDGGPGIQSARYAGVHGYDLANNAKLLRALQGVAPSRRGAQFRCVLVVSDARRVLAVAGGVVRGRIHGAPLGRGGFGYDPLFFMPRLRRTSAQLTPAEKHRISHRGRAAARMRRALRRVITRGGPAAPAVGAG